MGSVEDWRTSLEEARRAAQELGEAVQKMTDTLQKIAQVEVYAQRWRMIAEGNDIANVATTPERMN